MVTMGLWLALAAALVVGVSSKCLGTAKNIWDCTSYGKMYSGSTILNQGYGYLFWNPNVCGNYTNNLVGCDQLVDFKKYSDYIKDHYVNGSLSLGEYYNNMVNSIEKVGMPSTIQTMYCIVNCMACRFVDKPLVSVDPICPASVCRDYGVDASHCLPDQLDPKVIGVKTKTLTPMVDSTFQLTDPFDIIFAAFGVSNEFPYLAMPWTQAYTENCPVDLNLRGLDAVVVGFSFMPDFAWIKQNLDKVVITRKDGTTTHPDCAMVQPNGGARETVLVFCGLNLGTPSNPPVRVQINAAMRIADGSFTSNSAMSADVGTLASGPVMVYAERIMKGDPDFANMFKARDGQPYASTAKQVVFTTWTKGARQVHPGLFASPLFNVWTDQRNGVTVELEDGTKLTSASPEFLGLFDDDNDGFVQVALGTSVPATKVTFEAGLFFEPRNSMNVKQTALVRIAKPLNLPYVP